MAIPMSWSLFQARLLPSISHSYIEGTTAAFTEHSQTKTKIKPWMGSTSKCWKSQEIHFDSQLVLVNVSYSPLICGLAPNFPWYTTVCVTLCPAGLQKASSQAPPLLCIAHPHHCHLRMPLLDASQPLPLAAAALMKAVQPIKAQSVLEESFPNSDS